jgi:cyclopropane fatty-acyl-phospholipid synthase-like methyltransferase
MSSNVPEGAEIFEDWSLYDKVIHFNFMQHREMGEVIRSIAGTTAQPLRVLDLGCGDGRMGGGIPVASYVGVDLSQAALEAARTRLSHLDCPIELRHSDLAAALQKSFDPSPNLILASYSLHHYPQAELAASLVRLEQILAPDGAFIWIDIERYEQETRAEFLARFHRQQLKAWHAFEDSEIEEVFAHMSEADFPLTAVEKQQLTTAAGLQLQSTPFQDDCYAARCYLKQA